MPVPVTRLAARVLLVDASARVLLFRGGDPHAPERGTWWFTPGGGLDPGESRAQAAARELLEETGLVVLPDELGNPVLLRVAEFDFAGTRYEQDEEFFLLRVQGHDVDTSGFSELERRSVVEHRWWSRAALRSTDEMVFPPGLDELLDQVL